MKTLLKVKKYKKENRPRIDKKDLFVKLLNF